MRLKIATSREEFHEAVRINRSWRFWAYRIQLAYRSIPILLIFGFCGIRLLAGEGLTPGQVGVLVLVCAISVYSFWIERKQTQKRDEALAQMRGVAFLKADGVALALDSGATAFNPWTEFSEWKEGSSVIALRHRNTVLVLSKAGLLPGDVNEAKTILTDKIASTRR